MTEPRIQYVQTEDGLSIAYSVEGDGPPLICMPHPPFTNLETEIQLPASSAILKRAAQEFRIIRYDPRGSGMSERRLDNYSLEGFLLDLRAVVSDLQLSRFVIFGQSNGAPVSLTYAARNPDRVERLLLHNAWVRDSDWSATPQLRAIAGMFDKDWDTYTETFARIVMGWDSTDDARQYAEMMRASTTPDTVRAWTERGRKMDATEALKDIRCPTLILHTREHRMLSLDVARRIAAGISNARLVLTGDRALSKEDSKPALRAVDEFLGLNTIAAVTDFVRSADVHTILFTDVEGSTALTDRLGDEAARDLLRDHERIVRGALASHDGSEVKSMGDGFMASFGSTTKAVECAIAIQRALAKSAIRVRIGLNAGEPISEEEDLFGAAVNMAARIAAKAEGEEILVSDVVRQLAAGKNFFFNDRGEFVAEGFEEPVRVYEVRWREEG